MKITIEPTGSMGRFGGSRGRVWLGKTERGHEVRAVVVGIFPVSDEPAEVGAFFDECNEAGIAVLDKPPQGPVFYQTTADGTLRPLATGQNPHDVDID